MSDDQRNLSALPIHVVRKKAVAVKAAQLITDDDLDTARDWIESSGGQAHIGYDDNEDVTILLIETLEGTMKARWSRRDWIVQGVKGEFYPVQAAIFTETYEVLT